MIEAEISLSAPVQGDARRLSQLLSNLVANALTHGAKDMPVRIVGRTHEGLFELSVSNGGAPIDADTHKRLFQPFYRGGARGQGLGLGLYIASEIARAHGGALTVSSTAEETRFAFAMPAGVQAALRLVAGE